MREPPVVVARGDSRLARTGRACPYNPEGSTDGTFGLSFAETLLQGEDLWNNVESQEDVVVFWAIACGQGFSILVVITREKGGGVCMARPYPELPYYAMRESVSRTFTGSGDNSWFCVLNSGYTGASQIEQRS